MKTVKSVQDCCSWHGLGLHVNFLIILRHGACRSLAVTGNQPGHCADCRAACSVLFVLQNLECPIWIAEKKSFVNIIWFHIKNIVSRTDMLSISQLSKIKKTNKPKFFER